MPKTSSGVITKALAERSPARMLRAFIEGVAARGDVRVREKKIGGPAPAALLRANRGKLPDELLALFAEMNGVTFRFTLIPDDARIDGIDIDPLTKNTMFREREEVQQDGRGTGVYLSDFGGPDVLHLMFDCLQPEQPVHYVKPKKGPARLAAVGAKLPYQESGPGKFLVMIAKGGKLPPYPPQGKSWGLVFGAKPRSIFALHPAGFVAATAFGLKSKLPVYWK